MLNFLVYDGDAPATERPLRHAYLIGPESIPVAGEITFELGLVKCMKSNAEAAALAMQVHLDERAIVEMGGEEALSDIRDAGFKPSPLGVLTLQTCLLPERDKPYLLSLELARHRIMLFLNKLEEWQLFDIPADDPVMRLFEAARHAFTEALVAQRKAGAEDAGYEHGFSSEANRLAVKALWIAVEASERLAIVDAQRNFKPRVTGAMYQKAATSSPTAAAAARGKPPPALVTPDRVGAVLPHKPVIGCSVSPSAGGDEARRVASTLDFIQMPMRWIDMEPTEGKYNFKPTDQWIEWAVRKAKLPVAAGPVIDFRPTGVPEWLYIWENDYETLRELVFEHLKNLVTRYRRTVGRWTVLSGVHVNENFHFSFDQMMDLTRVCVVAVRKLHPQSRIIVEVTRPWGEYYTENRRSLPPALYAEMVTQAGIAVDGFSLRVQFGMHESGQSARDLMAFSAMLDRFAALDKPLSITAVGVPSRTIVPKQGDDAPSDKFRPGGWRGAWSESHQAEWLTAALGIAASKPFVQSICWQELSDAATPEMPHGGLLSESGLAKPAAHRLAALRKSVVEATPPADLGMSLLDAPVGAGA